MGWGKGRKRISVLVDRQKKSQNRKLAFQSYISLLAHQVSFRGRHLISIQRLDIEIEKQKAAAIQFEPSPWTKTAHKTSIIVMVFFYIRTFGDDLWHVDRHISQSNCVIVIQTASKRKWRTQKNTNDIKSIQCHFVDIAFLQPAAQCLHLPSIHHSMQILSKYNRALKLNGFKSSIQ